MASKARRLAGSDSFTVITSAGGFKTATLSREYAAGVYLIESIATDADLEIYLGSAAGANVGTATGGAKTITASAAFQYVTTNNANSSDAIVFTSVTASTLETNNSATWAPPIISGVSPSGLPNLNDTTTISGANFAEDVSVQFRKSDNSTLVNAKSSVRGSATSIIATRPDTFAVGDAPYDLVITNPTTGFSAISLNAITAGAVPVWSTAAGEIAVFTPSSAFSTTVSATDADGGSTITYSIASGSLPTSMTLNSSTGAISGTSSSTSVATFTLRATDSGGNYADRSFQLTPAFTGGNQSATSLYDLMNGMGIASSVSPSSGGTLTLNSVSLGSYDYTLKSGNQTVSSFTNSDWFTTTADTRSALIKVNGNLTINSGQTFIPSNRKLFTCIFVNGNLTLNGSISMTARGANHSGTGNSGGATTKGNILLINGVRSGVTNPQIPATGGAGGNDPRANESSTYDGGYPGAAGTAGGTGGGGVGARIRIRPGKGADGTSFSGGGGSSATDTYDISGQPSQGNSAVENGGAGANARNFDGYTRAVSGGAGNPGGVGAGNLSVPPYGAAGSDGTGGVVIIFVTGTISGSGSVVANGSNGGQVGFYGGASGGGSVNVFYGTDSFSGSLTANAGVGYADSPAGAGTARKLSIA